MVIMDETTMKDDETCFYLYEVGANLFYPIKKRFVVGRLHGDIHFDQDKLLSRNHFEITVEGESAFIVDLKTTNGIRVNGIKVDKKELFHNDVIQAGAQNFIFSLTENINDLNCKELDNLGIECRDLIVLENDGLSKDAEGSPSKKFTKMLVENLKRPLDYKQLPRIYWVGLGIAIIYYFLKLFFVEHNTYHAPFTRISHDFVNFLVGYYFTIAFIFFMNERFDQKKKWMEESVKRKRTIYLIFPCLIVWLFFSLISADFMQTQIIERTTDLEVDCKIKINIFKCSKKIGRLFDDKDLMSGGYSFKIVDSYQEAFYRFLEDKYALSVKQKRDIQKTLADMDMALEKKQRNEFIKHNKILLNQAKTIIRPLDELYQKIQCPKLSQKKLRRSIESNDWLELYCLDSEERLQGVLMIYDASMLLLQISNYRDDLLEGELKRFYPNGQIKELLFYENGSLAEQKTITRWNPSGEILYQGIYNERPLDFYKILSLKIVKECEREADKETMGVDGGWMEQCSRRKFDDLKERMHPIEADIFFKELNQVARESGEKMQRKRQQLLQESLDSFKCYSGEIRKKVLEDDTIQMFCVDSGGKLNGPYGEYFPSKRPKIKGYYVNGISSGHFKHFYENGVVSIEGNFYNNKWIGEAILRDQDGRITYQGDYNKSDLNVREIVQNKIKDCQKSISRKVAFGSAKEKMKDCLSPLLVEYMMTTHPAITEDFKKQIEHELLKYSNQIAIGDLKCPKGRELKKIENPDILHVCVNETGVKDGPYIFFNEKYIPKEAGLFDNDVKNGPFRQYDDNGRLKRASSFYKGDEIGISTWYNASGVTIGIQKNEEKLVRKYEKIFDQFYKQCLMGKQPGICMESHINGYCEKNTKIDCLRITEVQRFKQP